MSSALERLRGQAAPQAVTNPANANGAHQESVRTEYLQSLRLIERLHRLLLDVIKSEFDRQGESDLNSVQALLLYNIGESELTAGELKTRGYYLGSNVSYNLKKLVDMGYIHYKRSETDKRQVRVSLTTKGKDACTVIHKLYQRQLGSIEAVGQVGQEDLKGLNRSLGRLERFWSDQIRFRL
jgi:DNA-binding MarR family transcriptional regulator